MAVAQIKYPASVFGYSGGDPDGQSGVLDYCVASAAITAGYVAIVDTANLGQVKTAAVNSATQLIVGVAAEVAATGEITPIVVTGRAIAKVNTTVTAGDRLVIDPTTAGLLASITAGVAVTVASALGMVVAVAEESVATNAITACHVRIVKF